MREEGSRRQNRQKMGKIFALVSQKNAHLEERDKENKRGRAGEIERKGRREREGQKEENICIDFRAKKTFARRGEKNREKRERKSMAAFALISWWEYTFI